MLICIKYFKETISTVFSPHPNDTADKMKLSEHLRWSSVLFSSCISVIWRTLHLFWNVVVILSLREQMTEVSGLAKIFYTIWRPMCWAVIGGQMLLEQEQLVSGYNNHIHKRNQRPHELMVSSKNLCFCMWNYITLILMQF